MDSLDQRAPERAEIPRFDDGMVNIQELIRIMAESLVNEIMDAQAEDACADGNRRNGYRERALVTSVGTINLRIPKLRRGSYFPEDLLTRYSRVDRAVVAAVSEMVTCGVSTRKVERVAASLGIDRMSASQVSRICESLDDVVADLQERDLSGTSFPYIWVDATYVKCRDGGHVSSCALVTAIGAGADGYRRLLGLDAIDTESYAGWLAFLSSNPLRYQQSAESVDHSLIGEQVDVKLTSSSVAVMHGGAVVAVHPRLHGRKGQYSTNVEHMPENHAALDDPWSPERFASWARRVGPETASAIERVLASRAIVEQSFVSCRNILGLSKTYAPALLERACAKLNAASALPSYTGLKNAILAIKSSDAEERAKGRPVGAAGSGELVDRAKSAGRLRGADAYKRGGE